MKLQKVKQQFFSELNKLYPETEIQSFFNLLIEFKLNLTRIEFALQPDFEINESNLEFFKKAITDLNNSVPIQYIIGETEFYGLPFKVNPHVLIPRPETEELVEWITNSIDPNKTLKILDIGTGSGCIAISLAQKLPNANVFAIDVSANAIKTAKQNADLNNVKVHFMKFDILKIEKLTDTFDIIVSNPPYVRELEKVQIKPNVLKNEPHLALFVKDDNPLLFYNKIANLAMNYLNKNGSLFFEINQYLGKPMIDLLSKKGFQNIKLKKDFYQVDRMIKAEL